MNIIVLGAGLVGRPMALDLAKDADFKVTVADYNQQALSVIDKEATTIKTIQKDLSKPAQVTDLVSSFDMVVNAVPGFMGFQTLKACIEAGKQVIDIAFFPEDPFQLDELAKSKGVTAIMDIGVAPGMSNLLIGYVDHLLDETTDILIYVGGLPEIREYPYEYKAVFSPIDVIEEYTRTARYVEHGVLVEREALSDPELLNFPTIGTLEAFNTDGLRSLADTINCPNMKEKTLRYPGHIEKMAVLRETGFFRMDPIDVNGIQISPMDVTSKLLFPKWKLTDNDVDITIMQVQVTGKKDGKRIRYTYDLFDKRCPETNIHSMARTTGYTATMAARLVAKGMYTEKGLSVPEYIGKHPACVKFMLDGLAERNIHYKETVTEF